MMRINYKGNILRRKSPGPIDLLFLIVVGAAIYFTPPLPEAYD